MTADRQPPHITRQQRDLLRESRKHNTKRERRTQAQQDKQIVNHGLEEDEE